MNIARKALLLIMASLPSVRMATHGGSVLQRRVAAFSSVAWNRQCSPKSLSTPQQHQHQHVACQTALPLLAAMQHQPLFHSTKSTLLSKGIGARSITQLFMSGDDNDSSDESDGNEPRTSFHMGVLKKETTRLVLRTIKKVGKVSTRIRGAEEQYEKLRVAIDTSSSDGEMDEKLLAQLEQAPNIEQLKQELAELQDRLKKLNWLEEVFAKPPLKSKKQQLSVEDLQNLGEEGVQVVEYVLELDISDDESQKQKRIAEGEKNRRSKKEQAAKRKDQEGQQGKEGGRLPYRRYYTEQNVEIKVGKQATDNDVLSLSPEHRSGAHWWYHASGCAGSHVVLCTDAASPSEEDVRDAASLAALKSKCIGQSVIKVSMTRARNVSKPRGAKPGLVQLNGEVKTITVKKSEVEKRCKRLEETVVVN